MKPTEAILEAALKGAMRHARPVGGSDGGTFITPYVSRKVIEDTITEAMPVIEATLVREIEIFGRETKLSGRKTPLNTNEIGEMLRNRGFTPFHDDKSVIFHELTIEEIRTIHNNHSTPSIPKEPFGETLDELSCARLIGDWFAIQGIKADPALLAGWLYTGGDHIPLHASLEDRMIGKQQRPMTSTEEKDTKTWCDYIAKGVSDSLFGMALTLAQNSALEAAAKQAEAYEQEFASSKGAGTDIAKRIRKLIKEP